MPSIRWRLTLGYVVALVITMIVFGALLFFAWQRSNQRSLDARLQQRLLLEADLSARYLEESYRVLGRIVSQERHDARAVLEPSIASYFESIQDYLAVVDSSGGVLFASDSAAQLRVDQFESFLAPARPPFGGSSSGEYRFSERTGASRFHLRMIRGAGPGIAAVLVAAPSPPSGLVAQDLLSVMLAIAPLILLASVLLGGWIAGRSMAPLGEMVRELEAITDGRSLHRRVVVDPRGDEVARLGTAVNRMFERLERSFSALHRFTAEASHELKTPIMVLRAGVERALRHPGTPAESLQALDESLDQINLMTELVDSLLTLARADEGRLPLALEDCDLRSLVEEAGETASILGESAGLRVTTTLAPGAVPFRADRNRIRQLLLNLVTNAVKYTPAGGQVTIQLEEQESGLVITVSDTGIGIAAGDLPHIFDRFWRADPARSREGERPGTGLGLAITKWVAEAHGGTIAVQSRPGRGTQFLVTLPRNPPGVSVS